MKKVRRYILKIFLNSEEEVLSDEEIVAVLEKKEVASQPVIKRTLTKMEKEGVLIKHNEIRKAYSYDPVYGKVLYYTVKYYRLNKEKPNLNILLQRRLDGYLH